MKLTIDGKVYTVEIGNDTITVDGTTFKVKNDASGNLHTVLVEGKPYKVDLAGNNNSVIVDGKVYQAILEGKAGPSKRPPPYPPPGGGKAGRGVGGIKALMPGKIAAIKVKEGDSVAAGAVLLILEAMKMENEIRTPVAGVVKSLPVSVGSNVDKGDTLAVVE